MTGARHSCGGPRSFTSSYPFPFLGGTAGRAGGAAGRGGGAAGRRTAGGADGPIRGAGFARGAAAGGVNRR